MRIDYKYLNNFLSLVLDNDQSDFKLNAKPFQTLWPKGDEKALDKLVFHLEILADQSCLESSLTKKDGIGFRRTGSGWIVSVIPLRLYKGGIGATQIARQLKIARSTVYKILNDIS